MDLMLWSDSGQTNPLVDWEAINEMLGIYLQEWKKGNRLDYLSISLDSSFPLRLDAEVFRADLFSRLLEATSRLDDEERQLNEIHVVPYLHRNSDSHNIKILKKDFDYSYHRWTVGNSDNYEFIKRIYENLYTRKPDFLMRDVLDLLEEHPDLSKMNSSIVQKSPKWREKPTVNHKH